MQPDALDARLEAIAGRIRIAVCLYGPREAIEQLEMGCDPKSPGYQYYQVLFNDFNHLVDGGLSPSLAIRTICR